MTARLRAVNPQLNFIHSDQEVMRGPGGGSSLPDSQDDWLVKEDNFML